MLYETFITNQEILNWNIGCQRGHVALVDEAYARWLDEDKEQAQFYANCWTGTVRVALFGYHVQIEAESDISEAKIDISAKTVERARELVADLRRIGQEVDALSIDEWPSLCSLDEQAGQTMEELAIEYMALLVGAGLAQPLVETEEEVHGL